MGRSERVDILHLGDGRGLLRETLRGAESSLSGVTVRSVETPTEAWDRLGGTDCLVYGTETVDDAARELLSEAATRRGVRSLLVTPAESAAHTALEAGVTDVFFRRSGVDETALFARRLRNVLSAESTGRGVRFGTEKPNADEVGSKAVFFEALHEVVMDTESTPYERVQRLLELGVETLGATSGHLVEYDPEGEADGPPVVVTETVGDGDASVASFCRRVADSEGPLLLEEQHAKRDGGGIATEADSKPRRIGAKVLVGGELWGTLCFVSSSSEVASSVAFERTVLRLLGEWTSVEFERRRSRTELQRYETILDTLGDPVYALDSDGNYTYVNDAFVEHTGYVREEVLDEHVSKSLPETEIARGREVIRELLSSEDRRSATWEMTRVTADGEYVPTENHVALLPMENGEFSGTVGVIRDISRRKKRQEQLERERDRLAAVFDAAPQPLAHVRFEDGEPITLQVNEAFETVFGFEESELVDTSLDDHIVPDEERAASETINERARDGEHVEREITRVTADGEKREFLFNSASIGNGEDIEEGLGAYVDITERKRRIEQLEQIRRNVTDVVWMSTPGKESMDFISDSYEDVWGRSPESLREHPQSFVDAIHPEDRKRIQTPLESQTEAPDEYEETYRVVQPDGEIRWVHDRVSGVYEDGELTRVVGVAHDITERKQRERQLQTFRKAVENAGHAIYWTDEEGTIEYVNPEFEEQTRYDASEAIGEDLGLLRSEVHPESFFREMWQTVLTGERWEGEVIERDKRGGRYTVDKTISPVFEDDSPSRYVVVAADVTERHHRQQQLTVLQRVLRHDLRNNMNEILLAVQFIEGVVDDEAVHEQIEAIERTVHETISLSQNVKQMQEIFEGGAEVNQAVELVQRVRKQVSAVRTERPNVEVSVDVPEEATVVANGLIDRAIRNVLQNAIEHNDTEQPKLDVSVRHRPEHGDVALIISDNGPGIPEDAIEVLGTGREDQLNHLEGIGLWIVHWVVSVSGGDFEIAEADPRGAEVTLAFPAAEVER